MKMFGNTRKGTIIDQVIQRKWQGPDLLVCCSLRSHRIHTNWGLKYIHNTHFGIKCIWLFMNFYLSVLYLICLRKCYFFCWKVTYNTWRLIASPELNFQSTSVGPNEWTLYLNYLLIQNSIFFFYSVT